MEKAKDLQEYLRKTYPNWSSDHQYYNSLFSTFSRPRQVNPEAHDAKVSFWIDLLTQLTKAGCLGESRFCLPSSSTISSLLVRDNGMRPQCIDYVMKECIKRELAILYDSNAGEKGFFNASKNSNDASIDSLVMKMTNFFIKAPIVYGWKWLANYVSEYDEDDDETNHDNMSLRSELILVELVKNYASDIYTKAVNLNASLLSFDDFINFCEGGRISRKDAFILLDYMESHSLIAVKWSEEEDDDDHKCPKRILAVKFKEANSKAPSGITQEQLNILQLRQFSHTLDVHLHALHTKVLDCRREAREALGKQDRELAKHKLAASKTLTAHRLSRLQTLTTVNNMLLKIDSAHGDREILEAYTLGESALRQAIKGVDVDVSSDLMESIRNLIADVDEIGQIVTDEIVPFEAGADLEEELADIINEQLPSPPRTSAKQTEEQKEIIITEKSEALEESPQAPTKQLVAE